MIFIFVFFRILIKFCFIKVFCVSLCIDCSKNIWIALWFIIFKISRYVKLYQALVGRISWQIVRFIAVITSKLHDKVKINSLIINVGILMKTLAIGGHKKILAKEPPFSVKSQSSPYCSVIKFFKNLSAQAWV